ncbi:nucleoside/nucleotide kinase family protein [Nocardia sp. NPDC004068]|uniref:nucleoside/nucleotide kinase family protein n=1 Tax=Nocardia sp. NPDC004068 TaxID=3364303 RepID=UPI0036CA4C80
MSGALTLAELAARVRSHAAGRSRRFVLGIAGPPGAGKSTFAAALRAELDGLAEVAPMDGFHLPNAELRAAGALARKGEPDTFDVAGYLERLRLLRETPLGQSISWPIYDRDRHEPVADGVVFERQPIVLTEGNYLLLDDHRPAGWAGVRALLDEAWYLDAPVEQLRDRLVRRHIRGGRSAESAAAKVADSDLRNAELVASTRERADLVLRSDGENYSLR